LQEGSSDGEVESAVNGTRVKILDITALSKLRDEGHIARYNMKANKGRKDCLHRCFPGIPDTHGTNFLLNKSSFNAILNTS